VSMREIYCQLVNDHSPMTPYKSGAYSSLRQPVLAPPCEQRILPGSKTSDSVR
jgi:hypothetical protein